MPTRAFASLRLGFVALLVLAGCESDEDPAATSGPSAGPSSSAGQGGGGGDPGSGGTGAGAGVGGQASGGTGTGGGLPGACGSEANPSCGYGPEYCEVAPGTCPSPSNLGTCVDPATDCEGERGDPVCACNGQVYASECNAHHDKAAVGSQDGCTLPVDPFACGDALCESGDAYCESVNDYDACQDLPAPCADVPGAELCDCLEPYFCTAAPGDPVCTVDAEGNATIACIVTE